MQVSIPNTELVKVSILKENNHNVKKHPEEQILGLMELIKLEGFISPLIIDKNNTIWAGHGRIIAARQLGMIEVPCVRLEHLTKSQLKAIMLMDNRINESAWNKDNLSLILSEIPDFDFKEFHMDFDEFRIYENKEEGEIPEPSKEPKAKLGDIYQLGNHKIMCGDCTSTEQKEELFAGIKPDILATDPPYCSGGFQESGKSAGSIGTTAKPVIIKGDNLSTRGYVSLIKNMLLGLEVDTAYIFTDWRMWTWLCDAVESSGFPVKNMLVWKKDYAGMGFPWRTMHELILYSKQTASKMRKGNSYGNVLEAKRTGNHNHPTEKPVELIEMLLDNSEGEIVYDPFLGSGTTLIACEKQGKSCYGMEMDPKFVDVIIQRFESYSGKNAKKLN